MEKHPKAGQPVKIANGPLAGKYYVVHDWYVNQFQGKSMVKLATTRPELQSVKKRKYPLDERVVWGRIYPEMAWTAVHDDELVVKMNVVEDAKGETVELPPNVEPMLPKGKGKARMKSVKKEAPDDGGSAG
jgi:hypothetical protein